MGFLIPSPRPGLACSLLLLFSCSPSLGFVCVFILGYEMNLSAAFGCSLDCDVASYHSPSKGTAWELNALSSIWPGDIGRIM